MLRSVPQAMNEQDRVVPSGTEQDDALASIFGMLGLASPFFWFGARGPNDWLYGLIAIFGAGYWIWWLAQSVNDWLLRRRWLWYRPSVARVVLIAPGRKEPLGLRLESWWKNLTVTSRVFFVAFGFFLLAAVLQARAGGEIVLEDFGDAEVYLYQWRYWGVVEEWRALEFDYDVGWVFVESGRPLYWPRP
jgi:hypothetical protein